ncbi:MAG TPA: tetratricopeptide repeat protein, partial [Adhaeribacter sp.]|nr:tetratricopeptide repeat protein [Adhaeribacter sp.]
QQKLDSEIYILSKKIVENKVQPDALTEEELRYSATLTPLLSEKLEIYKAAVLNTRKWQAFNDLGVTYFEMAQKTHSNNTREKLLREAITNLTYASHRNPTAGMFYNLASAHHIKGNLIEAQRSYEYAIKLGGPVPVLQQVFADKAALEIEMGLLDEALTSLTYAGQGYQVLMNKGLAYILKGYYEEAAGIYEEALALKPNDPLAHYSLAIIGARTSQEDTVTRNLREATRRDRSLIAKAIDDPEFRSYVKLPAFREAIK